MSAFGKNQLFEEGTGENGVSLSPRHNTLHQFLAFGARLLVPSTYSRQRSALKLDEKVVTCQWNYFPISIANQLVKSPRSRVARI